MQVPEHNVETQTDEFLDRPASPLFVPIKTGVDQGTQILEGDLFDFELEVHAPPAVQAVVVFGESVVCAYGPCVSMKGS